MHYNTLLTLNAYINITLQYLSRYSSQWLWSLCMIIFICLVLWSKLYNFHCGRQNKLCNAIQWFRDVQTNVTEKHDVSFLDILMFILKYYQQNEIYSIHSTVYIPIIFLLLLNLKKHSTTHIPQAESEQLFKNKCFIVHQIWCINK